VPDDLIDVNYTVEEQPSGSITCQPGLLRVQFDPGWARSARNNFFGSGNRQQSAPTVPSIRRRCPSAFLNPYFHSRDGVSLANKRHSTARPTYDELNVISPATPWTPTVRVFNIGYPISDTSRLSFGPDGSAGAKSRKAVFTVQEFVDFLDLEGR